MPGNNSNNPTNVSLDVRNFSSSDPGWVNVTGSNGQPYSYAYSGGNNGNNGNLQFSIGGGNAATTVSLVADQRYQFQGDVTFVNDPDGQLTSQGNAPRNRVVNDRCSAALPNGQYKITVLDTTANATVPCDPVIINK